MNRIRSYITTAELLRKKNEMNLETIHFSLHLRGNVRFDPRLELNEGWGRT